MRLASTDRPAALLVAAVLLSGPTAILAGNLLSNPGFEAGDASGWQAVDGEGQVVAITAPDAEPCARAQPPNPRTGQFMFSAAVADGTPAFTPVVSIEQVVPLGAYSPGATVEARAFVAGAPGCSVTSDDTAELVVEFLAGAAPLGAVTSGALDPVPGQWNALEASASVPAGTDALRLRIVLRLDPGFASIDVTVDDVWLALGTGPGAVSGLRMDRQGSDLSLTWDPDCALGDRYGVYRGDLAAGYDSLAIAACDLPVPFASVPVGASPGEFFLVVPARDAEEGSYGTATAGSRPAALVACHVQVPADACATWP